MTGQSLPERGVATEAALIRRLIDVMDGYGIKVRWNPLQEVRAKYLNLVLFAATNNRQGFRWQFDDLMQSEARNACHEPPDKARLFRPCLSQFTWDVLEDGIWMELVNLTTGSPWHIGTVELPYVEPPKLPPPQPIVIADDGKKAAVITIASGARLLKEGLDAKLTVTDGLTTQTFLPAQVEVGSNGESLKLTFTTPAKFFDTPKTANYSLSLAYPDNPRKKYDRTASVGPVVFPSALVKYSAPEPEMPSSQPVKMKITSTIVRAVNGEGKLNIEFERDPKATEVVRFDVRGGDIAEMIATPTTMFPAGKPPRTIGGSGIVMLTLRNLSDANTITVTTTKIDKGTETQLDLQMLSVRDAAPPRQDRGSAGQ